MVLSVMVQSARMAPARNASSFPVISLVRLEVTIITSSAMVDMPLMVRYLDKCVLFQNEVEVVM